MRPEYRDRIRRRVILRPGNCWNPIPPEISDQPRFYLGLIRDGDVLSAAVGPLIAGAVADKLPITTTDLDQLCLAIIREISDVETESSGEGIRRLSANHLARAAVE